LLNRRLLGFCGSGAATFVAIFTTSKYDTGIKLALVKIAQDNENTCRNLNAARRVGNFT
jgi:hypothetical protein